MLIRQDLFDEHGEALPHHLLQEHRSILRHPCSVIFVTGSDSRLLACFSCNLHLLRRTNSCSYWLRRSVLTAVSFPMQHSKSGPPFPPTLIFVNSRFTLLLCYAALKKAALWATGLFERLRSPHRFIPTPDSETASLSLCHKSSNVSSDPTGCHLRGNETLKLLRRV
jgi:hypothetical protein